MENRAYQGTRIQTHHCEIYQRNLIFQMTPIQVNQIKRNAIRRKNVKNKINRTRQTHRRAILIRPTTVITDANDVRGRAIGSKIR